MFSDDFKQRLRLGKYSRWAAELAESQVESLLWIVGEYACRSEKVLELLERHRGEYSVHDEGFARAKLALELLARFGVEYHTDRPTVEDVGKRVRAVLATARTLTAEEWPTTRDKPWNMFERLPATSARKRRLLSVALCRRVWELLTDPRSRRAVEVAERHADGLATDEELRAANAAACELAESGGGAVVWQHIGGAADSATTPDPNPDGTAYFVAYHLGMLAARATDPNATHTDYPTQQHEYGAQCDLIREVFGNPFKPVAFAPGWLTSDAVALARGIYDEKAFDRMPILADALQDAGCDSDDVLDHCRDPNQIHVRGCWVLDGLLGR